MYFQNLKEVMIPPPHGDDDVPSSPVPADNDDLDSLSSDMDIPLPDDDKKTVEKPSFVEELKVCAG